MTFAKFQGNWFKIDGEIAENHAILRPVSTSFSLRYRGLLRINEWVRVLISSLYMLKRESNEESQQVFFIYVSGRN